jgi:hypothetical protein
MLQAPFLVDTRRDTDQQGETQCLSGPLPRGDVVRTRNELHRQVAHVHGAAIPLQPETQVLRPHEIFCQGIGPEIVPLFTHPVASITHHPCLQPTEILTWLQSCDLRQCGKESTDPKRIVDILLEQDLSLCPFASPLIITRSFLGSTSSWYQPGLNYRSNVLISTTVLIHLRIVYDWESA